MSVDKERQELYKRLWDLANELRGGADIWDFKQYILGMMFYRYISEDFENYVNEYEEKAGNASFEYSKEYDDEWEDEMVVQDLIKTKGIFIKPSHLFKNVLKEAEENCDHLNEILAEVFTGIEETAKRGIGEEKFSGLFKDIDLNSNKLGEEIKLKNEKLRDIMRKIYSINLGRIRDKESDVFGDAYEYLMGMYASNAGKRGGEYYTPPEVSILLIKLAMTDQKDVSKIYDPACGSGSLLLKYSKITGKRNVEICGQEINFTTYNLCRMNMLLHGVEYDKFDIRWGDTLADPKHKNDDEGKKEHEKKYKFDIVVSNPPYSAKWKGEDDPRMISDERFAVAGVLAPKSKADFAFILQCLYHIKEKGIAVIISFPGAMYRGGAEQKIRKYLVDNNYIDCIIQLADNFFYGTSIATCILILKKSKTENKTLFIDASKQFEKVKNRNKLNDENIQWIVDRYIERKDIDHISKLVENTEISAQDYNLSVNTYIEKEDTREKIDIEALERELEELEEEVNKLRQETKAAILELKKS